MTTQHNMPPMPESNLRDVYDPSAREWVLAYSEKRVLQITADLRAHAAALAERIVALEAKCTLYAASLKQADERVVDLEAELSNLRHEYQTLEIAYRVMHDTHPCGGARQPMEAEAVFCSPGGTGECSCRKFGADPRVEKCERLAEFLAAQQPATVDRDAVEAALQAIEDNDLPGATAILKTLRTATPPAGEARDGERALAFTDHIINGVFEGGDWGGGELQDLAEKYGLLQQEERTEPCGEVCGCRDALADFPTTCYRKTYDVRAALSQQERKEGDGGR